MPLLRRAAATAALLSPSISPVVAAPLRVHGLVDELGHQSSMSTMSLPSPATARDRPDDHVYLLLPSFSTSCARTFTACSPGRAAGSAPGAAHEAVAGLRACSSGARRARAR